MFHLGLSRRNAYGYSPLFFRAYGRPHRKAGGGSADKNGSLPDYFFAYFFAYLQSVNTAMAGFGRSRNAYFYLQMRMSNFVHKFIITQFLAFLHRPERQRLLPDNLSIFAPKTSWISILRALRKLFPAYRPIWRQSRASR